MSLERGGYGQGYGAGIGERKWKVESGKRESGKWKENEGK